MVNMINGRHVVTEGVKYLYFYGTSYLALPYHRQFIEYLNEGISQYGTALGSSPMSSPRLDIYTSLEASLAKRYGFECAILFASGFAAGQCVVKLHRDQDYKVYHGNIVHPALKLENKIKGEEVYDADTSLLQVVDFIDPIFFERYILNPISKVNLIDVSHAFGIFDDEIEGLSHDKNNIVCGSLNKGLGTNAGIVLCSKSLKEQLMKTPRYATASPPSPAECHALFRSIEVNLIDNQKEKLQKLLAGLDEVENLRSIDGFPAYNLESSEPQPYEYLKGNKMLIWRASYPSPDSRPVNRIVINAAHTIDDILKLKNCLTSGNL